MDIAELKKFEFLRHLNDDQLILLVNTGEIKKLKPGDQLIKAGDKDSWEYFLLAGEVDLIPPAGHPVHTVPAHSPEAMHALVRERPRPVNVVAHSAAAVLKVNLDALKNLLREAPTDSYEVRKALREDQPENKQLLLDIYSDLRNNKLILPSLPEVAVRIRRLIDEGTNSAKKISQAVNTDPAIAAKLIKAANSPLFRGTKEFETSSQAIVRLGMQTTKQLVTSFTVKELFKVKSNVLKKRMDALWQHSIEIASICFVLARHTRGLDPDQGLLAGLLHDIGVVPILMYAEEYPTLVNDPQLLEKTIKDLKVELGPVILKRWNFNEEMVMAAQHSENWRYQHDGEVDLADLVIVAHLHQLMTSEQKISQLEKVPAFRRLFPADTSVQQLMQIMEEAKSLLEETRQLLVA